MREKVVTLHKSKIKYNWKTNKAKNEREEKRVFSGVDKFKCCVKKGRRKKEIQDREREMIDKRKKKEKEMTKDMKSGREREVEGIIFIELLFSCLLEPVLIFFLKIFLPQNTRFGIGREVSKYQKVLKYQRVEKM